MDRKTATAWITVGVLGLGATAAFADTVPDAVGLTEAKARSLVERGRFRFQVEYDARLPEGLVASQDPGGLAERPAGTTVLLRVGGKGPPVVPPPPSPEAPPSPPPPTVETPPGGVPSVPPEDGPTLPEPPPSEDPLVPPALEAPPAETPSSELPAGTDEPLPDRAGPQVPSVLGKQGEVAFGELSARWNTVVEQTLGVRDLTGRVVNQVPAPHEPLALGQTVTIVIAREQMPAPDAVSTPPLLALAWRDAERALAQLGLRPSWRLVATPGAPPGTVIGQSPLPGSIAAGASEVVVRVARAHGTPVPVPPGTETPVGPPPVAPPVEPPSVREVPSPARPSSPSALAVPALLKPAEEDAFPRAYGATFQWSAVAGAQSYDWELQEERDGQWTTVSLQSVPTAQLRPERLTPGRFRWRVRATAGDLKGDWSSYRRLYMY